MSALEQEIVNRLLLGESVNAGGKRERDKAPGENVAHNHIHHRFLIYP
jgi:hypothetical protein